MKNLTTLGWLKHLQDPHWEYFEHLYLRTLYEFLTQRWWILQWGSDEMALHEWVLITKVLELDRKACVDLFLLLQSGLPGRTYANKLLWDLLTQEALDPSYEDLSHKVSSAVTWARKDLDRPPRGHKDLEWWWWSCYDEVSYKDLKWSPTQVPTGQWALLTGEGGVPLAPPRCWGPFRHQ